MSEIIVKRIAPWQLTSAQIMQLHGTYKAGMGTEYVFYLGHFMGQGTITFND